MSAPSAEAPEARLRAERRLVNAVVVEGFVNRLGFGIVTFALPLYALELGMSIAEVGLLVAAKALLQPAVKPLVGRAVDRWGTRKGYLAAVGFRFLASVALLFAVTPVGLYAVRLLQGLASAAQDPVSISVLAKGREDRVGRRFSYLYVARDVGKVAAGALAGLVLAATGSFRTLWVVVVLLAAVPLVVVWFFVAELPDRPAEPVAEHDREAVERAQKLLRDPRLRTIAALGLLGGLTATMTHALFQVYASEVAGLSAGQIGLVYSVSVGALLVAGPLAGWAGDRYGHGKLASVRGVANAGSSLIFLVFPTLAGVLVGRLVDETGKAAFRPTWGALVAQAARRARERGGRTAAGLDAWLSVGEALGPLIAGLLWEWAGVTWFLLVRAALGVGVELVFGRRLRALLRPGLPAAPAVLRPGPGRLELVGLRVDGHGEPLHLVAEPGAPVRLPGGDAADPAAAGPSATGPSAAGLAAALQPGGAPLGAVLLDGQDLAVARPAPGLRPVALVPAVAPEEHERVADVLHGACPDAAPEVLAAAWSRAGLGRTRPLADGLRRRVADLAPEERARLRVAAALVGDPAVLVVDERAVRAAPALRAAVDELARRHAGAVLTVPAVPQPAGPVEAERPAGRGAADRPAGPVEAERPAGRVAAERPAGPEEADRPAGPAVGQPAAPSEPPQPVRTSPL